MLSFIQYDHLQPFKNDVIPILEKDEIKNSLLLGLLQNIDEESPLPVVMAVSRFDHQIKLVFLQTDPMKKILFAQMDPLSDSEIEMVAVKMSKVLCELPGFIGEKSLVMKLAEQLSHIKQVHYKIEMRQRIYKLKHVKKPADSQGYLRKINKEELSIIRDWLYQFCEEVNLPITINEAKLLAKVTFEKGRLYAWEKDGRIVSMANATRPTKTNITINYVFTPMAERKNGYATNCVSSLSQLMLLQGYQTVSLFTDLDYPTSNKIYMEIGYDPVIDTNVVVFNHDQ
ncbi:GNAT family N-acetyltransferase [Bacillus sp. 03113]|uniref:GNAT family N-acetyltransferase n=1 Tax=Bacillus sp. 03113 TaxID=2578211 RepID=UPI001141CCDA|nr:GNAT family N-acetyltransferase [Bacillus sp. 03113]